MESTQTINQRMISYIKDSYLSLEDSPELFLTSCRKTLETILAEYITLVFEDEKKAKEILKQPLEAQISILYKNNKVSSKISSYMQIVRVCGNYGTHFQNELLDDNFLEFCDKSFRVVVQWYATDILKIDFQIDNLINELSRTKFVVHTNTSERQAYLNDQSNQKNYKKQKFKSFAKLELVDNIKQLLIMIIVSFFLYYIINK